MHFVYQTGLSLLILCCLIINCIRFIVLDNRLLHHSPVDNYHYRLVELAAVTVLLLIAQLIVVVSVLNTTMMISTQQQQRPPCSP